jgi:hypothetical protein
MAPRNFCVHGGVNSRNQFRELSEIVFFGRLFTLFDPMQHLFCGHHAGFSLPATTDKPQGKKSTTTKLVKVAYHEILQRGGTVGISNSLFSVNRSFVQLPFYLFARGDQQSLPLFRCQFLSALWRITRESFLASPTAYSHLLRDGQCVTIRAWICSQ